MRGEVKVEIREETESVVEKAKEKVVEAVDKVHTAAHKDDFKK